MNDRILERFIVKKNEGAATDDPEIEGCDDYGAFGWLRGVRDRAIMLELRKKNGNVRAIAYAWIQEVDFDPSIGIVIHAGGQKFKIVGRNLNAETPSGVRLFQGITRHRVPFIQEAEQSTLMRADSVQTIVEKIDW